MCVQVCVCTGVCVYVCVYVFKVEDDSAGGETI